jgi:hypothetical protein
LLELSERGGMEPGVTRVGVNPLPQYLHGLALATPHLAHFLIEDAGYGDATKIQIDY